MPAKSVGSGSHCMPGNEQRTATIGIAGKASGAPKLREASFEDYPQIARLLTEYGLTCKQFAQWTHLWVSNPAQNQVKLPIGWVLEKTDGRIVGYLGNIPLFYELEGQRILAATAHAWVVDAQYRVYALQLVERYYAQRGVELFLNPTVGPASVQAFSVFESLPVPVGEWDHSRFWITNFPQFVAGWLAMKELSFAKPLSYLFAVVPLKRGRLPRGTEWNEPGGWELGLCKVIDERFDVFWEVLRKVNRRLLLGVRSRQMLEWHFGHALEQGKAWILTASSGNRLLAYSIFFRHDSERFGLKRVRLVDFQSLDGDTAVLEGMLVCAFARCRNCRIDMLESIGFGPAKGTQISKLAPYQRELPSWLYFYKANNKGLADKLADTQPWDPSQFDGDASL